MTLINAEAILKLGNTDSIRPDNVAFWGKYLEAHLITGSRSYNTNVDVDVEELRCTSFYGSHLLNQD